MELLNLAHPPVAVTFNAKLADTGSEALLPQPAGCCFWKPAQRQRLNTQAGDHANCSVGSYTHGLTDLESAASGTDTGALVTSGWIRPTDFTAVAHLPIRPRSIRYEPLAEAAGPDVVLLQLSPSSLMTLQGACPDVRLATKPQCQIVPMAYDGQAAVSPGCAVSRVRTGLPADEMICALPAETIPAVVDRLQHTVVADRAVVEYASGDQRRFLHQAGESS
ncbi:DUF169 domain-containing protein [Streptomyces sp. NPDC090080]|uniref:DUF169 domain-containing protein n=1 Tax=Streptomyces sp. NPDC090080 TaxID=3365939 RepID=UPI0037F9CED7